MEMIIMIWVIANAFFIQWPWFYLWYKDRKANETNILLRNMLGDNWVHAKNTEEYMDKIAYSAYLTSKNTNNAKTYRD